MRRYVLLALAVLSCPCHLPLLAAVLAGTAVGGVISGNFLLLFGALGSLFVVSLVILLRESTVVRRTTAIPTSGGPEHPAVPK